MNTRSTNRQKLAVLVVLSCGLGFGSEVRSADVLMMVVNSTNPINADTPLADYLTAQGHTVSFFATPNTTSAELQAAADEVDVVIISESVDSGTVSPDGDLNFSLLNSTTPVISFESFMWDDALWTGPTAFEDYGISAQDGSAEEGLDDAQDTIYVQSEGHPAAAGAAAGGVQVYNSPYSINWGVLGPDAEVIASGDEAGGFATIFVYEVGDELIDGTVTPGIRIGMYLGQQSEPNANTPPDGNNLTAQGLAFFDAAVNFATAPPPAFEEISINCGGPRLDPSLGTGIGDGRVWEEDTNQNPSQYLVSSGSEHGVPRFKNVELTLVEPRFTDNATNSKLFGTERWAEVDIEYQIPVPPGDYDVALLFAEVCCSGGCIDIADPTLSPGLCRVFDVYVNGELVEDKFSQHVEAMVALDIPLPNEIYHLDPSRRPDGWERTGAALARVYRVEDTDLIDIIIADLGPGNPPENAAIKGINITQVTPETCDNGDDDDGDGAADCDDSDCEEDPVCQCMPTEETETTCDDGVDNDCDDNVDDADVDCQCMPTEETETTCDDGVDNDCDDNVDDVDDDCQGVGPFLRGDCDGNGTVGGSPTEAIVLLGWAFRGGSVPDCLAACDAEANGSIGVTDALRILRHAFLGIGEPDPPFPECTKSDRESDESIGCEIPFCSL